MKKSTKRSFYYLSEECIEEDINVNQTGIIKDDFYKGLENQQSNCWLNTILQTIYNEDSLCDVVLCSKSQHYITHTGTVDSGHYIAYIYNKEKNVFIEYSDTSLTCSSEEFGFSFTKLIWW